MIDEADFEAELRPHHRELGWEAALLEDYGNGHGTVWSRLLAGLPDDVASLGARGAPR